MILPPFPIGTSVRTIGPEDQWTIDDNGRMHLNGIPTNMHSAQPVGTSRETEVFQTPPTTPRHQEVVEEDDGVIYLNRILPIDPHIKTPLIHCLAVNRNRRTTLIRKFLIVKPHCISGC